MLNRDLIEKEFGFLGDTIYGDDCQMGLPPLRTQLAGQRFMADYAACLAEGGETRLQSRREDVRVLLSRLIGGAPQGIAFTKNTTEGLSILAMGYPMGPGDNVVTCDLENPSNLFPWFNASRQRGYEVRVAKTRQGRVTLDDLTALMDENTRIVTLSAVQAGTGYFTDLAALSEACHRRGAILAVDAIQAVGRMKLDAEAMGIDYLSCGGYKGLMVGFGVGFLWCRPSLIPSITPPYAGPQSAVDFAMPPDIIPGPEALVLRQDAGRFEAGTHNAFGIAMLGSSVGLLLELGADAIQTHVLQLEDRLRTGLAASGLEVLAPEDVRRRSGLVVAYYPPRWQERVSRELAAHKIRMTHRPGYLRLAIGLHNTPEHMEIIARAFHAFGQG